MWDIINEIRRQQTMSGYQIVQYCHTVLGRNGYFAGACIARALQYGHIHIIGTTFVNAKRYNIYA